VTEDLSVYDLEFFRRHNIPNGTAYRLGKAAAELWQPDAVIDVGCATGNLLRGLMDSRYPPRDLLGVDHPDLVPFIGAAGWQAGDVPLVGYALDQLDTLLEFPAVAFRHWALVVCTEVAEHLPPAAADRLPELLTRMAGAHGRILWSAAIPGQGGTGHINERPIPYWQEKFSDREFYVDLADTGALSRLAPASNDEPWYERVMVYRRLG